METVMLSDYITHKALTSVNTYPVRRPLLEKWSYATNNSGKTSTTAPALSLRKNGTYRTTCSRNKSRKGEVESAYQTPV